jgi:Flp pilus assembly protein TadD/quercetin dioxygenase-like cupin family protein
VNRSLAASCLALVALSGLGCPEAPKKSPSLASRIELAAGDVQVQQAGGQPAQAIAGLLLRHGAVVKVGPGDRALIRLDDGSGVFLRQATELALEKDGLKLASGELWVEAPPQEKEPARYAAGEVTVTASDAGFDLKRSPSGVEVYVARGLCVVAAPGGRAELKAGERAVVAAGKAPAVAPVAFWDDWTGGMADRRLQAGAAGAASGRIYAIDRARPGALPQELEIRAQGVTVTIREGVARTTVDQRFFNPGVAAVEGYYWFTIPEGAAVDRFALELNGTLIDGEVIERKQAAEAYEAAVRSSFDPALLEWIDGRTFRARIFPIPAAGERRVVLSYLELLPTVDGRTQYVYPMGGAGVQIQEFSLQVELGDDGKKMQLATTADARIEDGGGRVTVRRSGYRPQGDFLLEMTGQAAEPMRAMRVPSSRGEAAYVMLRYAPDVGWAEVKNVPGNVVVVVDTSAGGDDADRQLRADVAEAILRALSTSDKFALMAADLTPRVLYPDKGLAPADPANIGQALERLSGVRPGGATDLGALFDVALKRLHGAAQPAVVYIGDGRPTVGELEGDTLAERLTRSIAGSSARLFTIGVGADANHGLLDRLARIGGGSSFRVDLSEQAVQEALRFVGMVKTPTITGLKLDAGAGLDQVFVSSAGKLSRGQEVTLLARTHHPLPDSVTVSGELAGKPFSRSYRLSARTGRDYAYVPTLWARRYLSTLLGADLQRNRGVIIRLGVDYALMTPFSSFLVLESEDAYRRSGIQRRQRDPIWGLVPHAALDVVTAAPLALFGCDAMKRSPAREEAPSPTVGEPAMSGGHEPLSSARTKSASRYSRSADDIDRNIDRPTGAPAAAAPAAAPPAPPTVTAESTPPGAAGGFAGSGRRARGEEGKMGARAPGPRRDLAALKNAPAADAFHARGGLAKDKREADNKDRDAEKPADQTVAAQQPLSFCSDAARRSLAHRRAIWASQLDQASGIGGWLGVLRRAASQCELPHRRDRNELLDLIQRRVSSPGEVAALIAAAGDQAAQDYVRRQLLQRAVTPDMESASAYLEALNWVLADAALAKLADPQKRIAELRHLCERSPQSVGCALRLIRALVAGGKPEEALPVALKLREDGRASPGLMQQIGDLLATAGRDKDAERAYSEIVEFAPHDPAARQLLGDIYLRHGWYELAYRQYRTLTEMRPDDPLATLRFAAAAAGAGRTDESLRLERKVSGGEGEPGPTDPRRWARLWSAARIARLMLAPDAAAGAGAATSAKELAGMRESMERTLRRLQLLSSPGVLFVLTWEDLDARLALALNDAGKELNSPDRTLAGVIGLSAMATGVVKTSSLNAVVTRQAGAPVRPVRYTITAIVWDGQRMTVSSQPGKLEAATQTLALALPAR